MDIQFYTLGNKETGIEVTVSNLGASLVGLICRDKDGNLADVIVGPETPDQLKANTAFMGSTVGRFANRIKHGQYTFEGESHQLSINDGLNHLHGGVKGIHMELWDVVSQSDSEIVFTYTSPDGDDGYPGALAMQVRYVLTDANSFQVIYNAETDKATPVNLAQHAYWNLTGDPKQTIVNHTVQSDDVTGFLEVSDEVMPTGEIVASAGTVFDFSAEKVLAPGLDSGDEQIKRAGGYDHCLVFGSEVSDSLANSITFSEATSGRVMKVSTNMPASQLYSGNFLDGSIEGKGGSVEHRTGFCVETQHYPDAVNFDHFPSPILKPGEKYEHVIEYAFSVA